MDNQDQGLTPTAEASWQEAIPLVERIWAEVFETVNRVLKVHVKFGFEQFSEKMNPKLENVILALNVLETVLDAFYTSGALEPSETRKVLNAKQQILLVQQVADALQVGSQEDYAAAIEKMSTQAVF